MLIKTKHSELDLFALKLKNDSESLDVEINKVLGNLKKLMTIWQGNDADIFYDNLYNYFNRMKVISETLSTYSDFISDVNQKYIDSDETFARDIMKEADMYE